MQVSEISSAPLPPPLPLEGRTRRLVPCAAQVKQPFRQSPTRTRITSLTLGTVPCTSKGMDADFSL
jgi:hypothetical protein